MGFIESTATGVWDTLLDMAPYLLFGFLVAGVLSVLVPASLVERHLGGRGILPSLKAAAFGVPLPLCSCGVIPVSASLRRHGASRGATTAFLLSTPQTGVDSIMVTLSLLGPVFAVFRPLAALVTGVAGGGLVDAFDGAEDGEAAEAEPDTCQDSCCSEGSPGSKALAALRYGFYTLPQDIGRSLLIGLLLAGLITALVPKDLATLVGTGVLGLFVMMAFGLPIYVCATASVPIAAALIYKGVSPGAAFVFLVTGPATNAATIATVWKVLGRRTALIYLGTVAVSALVFGALLNLIYTHTGQEATQHMHKLIPDGVKVGSAAVLLLVLTVALLYRPKAAPKETTMAPDAAETVTLDVQGMSCSHCVGSVTRALDECAGVDGAEVDLKSGRAVISGRGLDASALQAAVEALGYTVTPVPGGTA